MSKKLTIQSVNAAHQAAADANTKANEVREALRARLLRDHLLAGALSLMIACIRGHVNHGTTDHLGEEGAHFRDELEPTANSYGYTLADHPTRRDLVVVQPLEN